MSLELDSFTLDLDAIQDQVSKVLNDQIYYFGIRHHSAISTFHLIRALEERKPKLIFLEMPYDLKDLIIYAVDGETVPPIAFYSAFIDNTNILGVNEDIPAKFQSWFPLVKYSAEYVVLKKAHQLGIEVILFDIPYVNRIKYMVERKANELPKARDMDFLYLNSRFIKEFTDHSGYRTFNEAWDSIFEIQGLYHSTEEFRKNILLFAAATRATLPADMLEEDSTLKREGFMKHVMDSALAEKNITPAEVMVVCGALHALVLSETQGKDVENLDMPESDRLNSLVPFSYYGISEFAGYGAGNRAPLYYERVWNLIDRKEEQQAYQLHALDIISKSISAVRDKGEVLSTADTIAAYQSAILLAKIRKRKQPNLDDIRDALITVCVKGDRDIEGNNILHALDRYMVGSKIGKVTEKLGMFPLSIEFYSQLDLYELPRSQKKVTLDIQLNNNLPKDLDLSAFLNKTAFLDLTYARVKQTQNLTQITNVFVEKWVINWNPGVDARLLELNLVGSTIEAAVQAVLLEKMEKSKRHPNEIVPLLFDLLKMRIWNGLDAVIDVLVESIETSSSFLDLGDAFSYLVMFIQYCSLRNVKISGMDMMVANCFKRACFLMPTVAVEEDRKIDKVVSVLFSLIENALVYGEELDFELLTQMTQTTIVQTSNHAIKGALTGILTKVKAVSRTEISRQIRDYSISGDKEKVKVGDFLWGLLRISRNLMHDEVIFSAMNDIIGTPSTESFIDLLPGLKKCFAEMTGPEKTVIIIKIKQLTKEPKSKTSGLSKKKYSVDTDFLVKIQNEAFSILEEWKL
ncbi:MAG: DUF5682 family protein [Candidatus Odinarchaeota archaeon]